MVNGRIVSRKGRGVAMVGADLERGVVATVVWSLSGGRRVKAAVRRRIVDDANSDRSVPAV